MRRATSTRASKMNMSDNLTLFIAITAAAVVLQMLILLVMCVVMFKLSKKLQAVTDETQSRLIPVLDNAKVMQQEIKSFLETSRPKIDVILDNRGARDHHRADRRRARRHHAA